MRVAIEFAASCTPVVKAKASASTTARTTPTSIAEA
jgi:hypothetical protein